MQMKKNKAITKFIYHIKAKRFKRDLQISTCIIILYHKLGDKIKYNKITLLNLQNGPRGTHTNTQMVHVGPLIARRPKIKS